MMGVLKKFLVKNKKDILELTEEKSKKLVGILGISDQLKLGLELFYDQLVKILESSNSENNPSRDMLSSAAAHGQESLRLGYSLSQVVHSYGAICQSITEVATLKNIRISSEEFNVLNASLDVAIAAAVSEYQFESDKVSEQREIQHLGFLAHELRNALYGATVAHEMIKAGLVGAKGSTSSVLEANLVRMRNLIDRSLFAVRMRADSDLYIEKFNLLKLYEQVAITSGVDANKKNQSLITEIDPEIEIVGDSQIIISALANLVQNAIKYSKYGGKIWVRAKVSIDKVFIDVEDQCGGIELENVQSLFEPYVQNSADRSGLGLGLALVQQAVHLSQGKISVQNLPNRGCKFIMEIPLKLTPVPSSKLSVSGKDAVQPNFKIKREKS